MAVETSLMKLINFATRSRLEYLSAIFLVKQSAGVGIPIQEMASKFLSTQTVKATVSYSNSNAFLSLINCDTFLGFTSGVLLYKLLPNRPLRNFLPFLGSP